MQNNVTVDETDVCVASSSWHYCEFIALTGIVNDKRMSVFRLHSAHTSYACEWYTRNVYPVISWLSSTRQHLVFFYFNISIQ